MPDPIGVALIGPGRWAHQLAQALARINSLRLVICQGRSPERAREFAQTYGCQVAESLSEALAHPGVDAAIITTPSVTHPDDVRACVQHGCHVFIEKPLANSLKEGMEIARLCQEAGLVLMVGHEFRRFGAARAMKSLVDEGQLGTIGLVEATFTLPATYPPGHWRSSRASNRGGPLMQLGIHHAETLQHLLGPVTAVQGFFAHSSAPVDVDDVGTAQLDFEAGTHGIVATTFISPHTYEIHLYGDEANLHYTTDMWIWPEALQLDAHSRLELHTRGEIARAVEFDSADALAEQFDEFARSIRGETEPETGAREGLLALALVEAALISADRGKSVNPQELLTGSLPKSS